MITAFLNAHASTDVNNDYTNDSFSRGIRACVRSILSHEKVVRFQCVIRGTESEREDI